MKLLERGWKRNVRGVLCLCLLLHLITSTPVCMYGHEPSEPCLSIITCWSANTCLWRPDRHISVKLCQSQAALRSLNYQNQVKQKPLSVCLKCPMWKSNCKCLLCVFSTNEEWMILFVLDHLAHPCQPLRLCTRPPASCPPTIITSCAPHISPHPFLTLI